MKETNVIKDETKLINKTECSVHTLLELQLSASYSIDCGPGDGAQRPLADQYQFQHQISMEEEKEN